MIGCHDAIERFSEYLDGYLSDEEQRSLIAHLDTCSTCRLEWERFQETVALVGSLGEVKAPADFAAKVQARLRERPLKKLLQKLFLPLHVKLPLEAFALLILAFGGILLYRSSPELQHKIQGPTLQKAEAPPATPEGAKLKAREEAARKSAELLPDAALILKVTDLRSAEEGLRAEVDRYGGRSVEEVKRDVKDRQEVSQVVVVVVPKETYPSFKEALRDLGEVAVERERLGEGVEEVVVQIQLVGSRP